MGSSSSAELISLYRKRAKQYDRSTLLLYLAGFRHGAYRKLAVQHLALCRGDTVVDIGCGTGLNFSLLQDSIGPHGKIIGVDLTDAMLDKAAERVEAQGWSNVELVKRDAANFEFPSSLNGILSTFALTLIPKFDEVIRDGAVALTPGKRYVVLDFKRPSGWLMDKAAPILSKLLTGPFGGSIDMAAKALGIVAEVSDSSTGNKSVPRWSVYCYWRKGLTPDMTCRMAPTLPAPAAISRLNQKPNP